MRIGHGYDTHRLIKGRKLILGGIWIDYDKGLDGHSDADVLVHAIMDAILGAAALGDIGKHFPDTDDRYKGISSLKLLTNVANIIKDIGYKISNIDATIIAQSPKLSPYIDDMRKCISDILNIDIGDINIKATTEEGMGYTGRGEGISAHAVVLLYK